MFWNGLASQKHTRIGMFASIKRKMTSLKGNFRFWRLATKFLSLFKASLCTVAPGPLGPRGLGPPLNLVLAKKRQYSPLDKCFWPPSWAKEGTLDYFSTGPPSLANLQAPLIVYVFTHLHFRWSKNLAHKVVALCTVCYNKEYRNEFIFS